MECYECDWKGAEEELAEQEGNLMFYDTLLQNNLKGAKVTRVNLLCPKCGAVIRSKRLIDGVELNLK